MSFEFTIAVFLAVLVLYLFGEPNLASRMRRLALGIIIVFPTTSRRAILRRRDSFRGPGTRTVAISL